MSTEDVKTDTISIDIDDLTEVVGGVLNVTPLNESVVVGSQGTIVAFNPETCPGTAPYPGGPSTCMCPGRVTLR